MNTGDPDVEYVMAVLRGARDAFEHLHRKYVEAALRFAKGFYDCPSLAEGAVNVAFTKAYRSLHLWNPQEGNFKTWLFRILRNFAIEEIRKEKCERGHRGAYGRTRRLADPGDVALDDACEYHSERWSLASVRDEVDGVLATLGSERRSWLIELPDRRQLDVEKAALSRARRAIAHPLDIHSSGPALRRDIARELMLTRICGRHAGGAHL
jgi:RNA polymerase sigma factor (sigma-70 family)